MNHDIYRSTDTNAPTIGNNNGDLAAALDKILVTGYNTQSITSLAHSAGVITANKTAHGYSVGNVISISGAAPDTYNGRITIVTVPDANNFTYAPVGSNPASTPATGTILASVSGGKAGLGWELIATGTNVRCYRPRAGTRMYLGIDDTGNVYECKVRGFETQTAAGVGTGTGTGPFPTAAQLANGVFWQKTSNSAGNRAWLAMGDDKRFFIHININASDWNTGYFGDIFSYKSGDAYHCLLMGKGTTTAGSSNDTSAQFGTTGAFSAVLAGHYMPRSYTQVGSAIQVTKAIDSAKNTTGNSGNGSAGSNVIAYPDPISGALLLSRFFIVETIASGVGAYRGYLPGIWAVCHNFASMAGVADADPFNGADALTAMTFELRRALPNGQSGAIALETTAASDWT